MKKETKPRVGRSAQAQISTGMMLFLTLAGVGLNGCQEGRSGSATPTPEPESRRTEETTIVPGFIPSSEAGFLGRKLPRLAKGVCSDQEGKVNHINYNSQSIGNDTGYAFFCEIPTQKR